MLLLAAILIFAYGICIGSFLNVCIFRIPQQKDIVKTRSACMNCGYQLKWYDLIPLVSYILLRGKCRKCGTKLSVQYPIIEALNGVLYLVICSVKGITVDSVLCCFLTSALIVLAVIDFRKYEIPIGINIFIFALGVIRCIGDMNNIIIHLIGMTAVSIFLLLLQLLTAGTAIGGGDIKLMAAAGLFLGGKDIVLAFVVGCIAGSIVHLIRMKVEKTGHMLAFGPYLAFGIWIAALWGERFWNWYEAICLG